VSNESVPLNRGYGLIGGFGLVYFTIGISYAHYIHAANQLALSARALLIDAIFQAGMESEPGAVSPNDGNSSTLINVDVENAFQGLRSMHDTWACLITVVIGLYLLYRELGLA
jgi:ATP-binding cassette, subfamily C (CFTR/MRP), member 1